MSNKLSMYKGDDKTITVTVTENSSPVDITGSTFRMTIKASDDDTDDTNTLFATTVTTHSDAANGETQISIGNATSDAFTPGNYYYDIQYSTAATTVVTTLVKDSFAVLKDVSRTSP